MRSRLVGCILLLLAAAAAAEEWPQRFADLGDFRLQSGEVIRNCRIGYRTAGTLNADRSNAILVPTWFLGRSEDLAWFVGPGKSYDTSKYFVIVVDALGNGVSSSPSNSREQPGAKFPQFTIRDMVRSQYELVTRELKLAHLHCVAGSSMGGMQTFQWVVSYPDFMTRAIPIVGTPKQTSYDILLWQNELDLLEAAIDSPEETELAMQAIAGIHALEMQTPAWVISNVKDAKAHLATYRRAVERSDPYDHMSQLRAMLTHDIGFVEAIKPDVLVIVALQDEVVHPAPAREFARTFKTAILTLSGDCGHLAAGCELALVNREMWSFLGGRNERSR